MPRRHVILFQPRFASLVESGTKPHTIRPVRKRAIQIGDTLDLRAWTGKPYRSKQRKLREATCTLVSPFELRAPREGDLFMRLGSGMLYVKQGNALARADGFRDAMEMCDWFEAVHGLPFAGVLIEWKV